MLAKSIEHEKFVLKLKENDIFGFIKHSRELQKTDNDRIIALQKEIDENFERDKEMKEVYIPNLLT